MEPPPPSALPRPSFSARGPRAPPDASRPVRPAQCTPVLALPRDARQPPSQPHPPPPHLAARINSSPSAPPPPAPTPTSFHTAPPPTARRGRSAPEPPRCGGQKERGAAAHGKPGDWSCPRCDARVFASKGACFKCGFAKPRAPAEGRDAPRGATPRGNQTKQPKARRGPALPRPSMADNGVEYSGPLINFIRSCNAEESDNDEEEEEVEDSTAWGLAEEFESSARVAPLEEQPQTLEPESGKKQKSSGLDGVASADRIGRASLLLHNKRAAAGTALDGNQSIGFTILQRMGWHEGVGLGKNNEGHLLPVAVRGVARVEGVGLGCTDLPDAQVLALNVEQLILEFVANPNSPNELPFDPDLSKADRVLVHELARKHNLGHRSKGKGDSRFITVFKQARGPVSEADIEQQYEQVQAMGYSHQNRGMGLGFSGRSHDVRPPKALLDLARIEMKALPKGPQAKPRAQAAIGAPAAAPPSAGASGSGGGATAPLQQWANVLHAFSSQYSPTDHSARQCLGKPAVFPSAGSHPRAWAAVPRAAAASEWIQVGFRTAVFPSAVVVLETFTPGAVVRIRGAHVGPAGLKSASWRVLWQRPECSSSADASGDVTEATASRAFAPNLLPAASDELVNAVEVELSTQGWDDTTWTEIDAIRLDGFTGNQGSSLVTKRPDLVKQRWETDRQHESRVRFAIAKFGESPPVDEISKLRQAALSMVYSNMKLMGCRYPQQVEEQVGLAQNEAASGYAVDGQLASSKATKHGRWVPGTPSAKRSLWCDMRRKTVGHPRD